MTEPVNEKQPPVEPVPSEPATARLKCGIVMPISALDGCNESHWADVLEILRDSIEKAGFDASLVSHANEAALIHKTIVQNLHDNPIVVCDVSGKNSNVMFELGMRLTFDKPTIVIKDDKTSYSFDTSPIEHLEYPRDLRFSRIVDFKDRLTEKIRATHAKESNDPNYSTFLKHFGDFITPKIDKREVPGQEYIIDRLNNLTEAVRYLVSAHRRPAFAVPLIAPPRNRVQLTMTVPTAAADKTLPMLGGVPGILNVVTTVTPETPDNTFVIIDVDPSAADMSVIQRVLNSIRMRASEILSG